MIQSVWFCFCFLNCTNFFLRHLFGLVWVLLRFFYSAFAFTCVSNVVIQCEIVLFFLHFVSMMERKGFWIWKKNLMRLTLALSFVIFAISISIEIIAVIKLHTRNFASKKKAEKKTDKYRSLWVFQKRSKDIKKEKKTG